MTSYTNTFTGAPIQVTPTSFRQFTIAVNTTLSWPQTNEDNSNTTADTMEVTASSASLSLIMPPANEVSNGKACLIRNVGAQTFTVKDNVGGMIQSIAAGQVYWVYVQENSTVAGSWSSFQFGTGTSSADAAALDGNGLTAIGSLLNVAFPVSNFNANFTLSTNYRATIANWTGGAGTFSFSSAATLGNNWFVIIKNSGSGALVLDPNGGELIDGVSTISLSVGESCIVACTGTAFLSICKNTQATVSFTRLVKSVAGSSNVTLTSAEALYNIQEYTGLLTGNISVIVPTSVATWHFFINTTGAFTLTVKTAAGTGIVVPQGTRQILDCDGTNVVKTVDSGSGTVTSVATGTGLSGGPITTSGTINLANTAVTPGTFGSSSKLTTMTVDAQGRITAASETSTFNIGAGTIDGTTVGATTPSTGAFTSLIATSLNGDAFAGFRNRIINGSFSINQRSYVSATATSTGVYMHDRWKAGSGGCTYTFTQNLVDTTITITAGTLIQVIEAGNVEGGTYTLSWTGTAQGKVDGGSFLASPITVTGKTANTNITIEFNTGTLGKVQFEPGSYATPFERRMNTTERLLAYRYYFRRVSLGTNTLCIGGYSFTDGNQQNFHDSFPVEMYAAPTLTKSADSDFYLIINQTTVTAVSIALSAASKSTALLTTNCNVAANYPATLASSNSSAWLAYSAEI